MSLSGLAEFWVRSDLIARSVAALLLAMSICAWVLILWKSWTLRRARRDIGRGVAAFWGADGEDSARARLAALDREGVLTPLLDAQAAAQPGNHHIDVVFVRFIAGVSGCQSFVQHLEGFIFWPAGEEP